MRGGEGTLSGTLGKIMSDCKWPFLPGTTAETLLSNPRTLLTIVAAYLLALASLSAYMRLRPNASFGHSPPFTRVAVAHNAFLSALSLCMNLHVTWVILSTADTRHTVCIPRGRQFPIEMETTLYVFLVSKVYELLDTPILVMRRRKLSFLHVWHHSTVVFEVWGWIDQRVALGLYGMWFNTAVHVAMYAYYAFVLNGYKVRAKVLITLSQIVQFVTGFLSLIPFFMLHLTYRDGCQGSAGLLLSSIINGSYLILFVMFYRDTYSKAKGASGAKSYSQEHATTSTLTSRRNAISDSAQKTAKTIDIQSSIRSSIKQRRLTISTPSDSATVISTSSNLETPQQG